MKNQPREFLLTLWIGSTLPVALGVYALAELTLWAVARGNAASVPHPAPESLITVRTADDAA